jgi:broad specificity phosphatase PhoE
LSTLVLVRHGQASFLEADYDRLSPLGQEQARQLGAHWARHRVRVDEVWVGPRRRQRQTAEGCREAYVAGGGLWPEPRELPALDEYQAEQVMKHAALTLAQRDESVKALSLAFAQAGERQERHRAFERFFQAVVRRWVAGELDAGEIETWHQFRARVHDAFRALTGEGDSGRRVVAFTSAGAIGVTMQAALGLSDEHALEMGWVVKNASLTEFVFSGGRITLTAFNNLPHLPEPSQHTFR